MREWSLPSYASKVMNHSRTIVVHARKVVDHAKTVVVHTRKVMVHARIIMNYACKVMIMQREDVAHARMLIWGSIGCALATQIGGEA